MHRRDERRAPPAQTERRANFLWDPTGDGGPVPLREQGKAALAAALTPDGRFVIATEPPGKIRVYDTATGKPTRSLVGRKYETRPAFSPDGVLLATTFVGGGIRLYDFAAGRLLGAKWGGGPLPVASPFPRTAGCLRAATSPVCLDSSSRPGRAERLSCGTRRVVERSSRFPPGTGMSTACPSLRTAGCSPRVGMMAPLASGKWPAGRNGGADDGHRWLVKSVDFAPDGGRLVSASSDGTALVWQVFGPAPADRPAPDSVTLWADLARDGITAHRAMAALIAAPRQAIPLLRERLRPAAPADPQQIARLIAELDSKLFAVRENAISDLECLGDLAEPALHKARQGSPSLEFRRRLEQLLEKLQGPVVSPERLDLRGVEVLERLGSAEARRLLGELAKGADGARLTREAKANLARLERR